jgi:hypothetical protein
MDTTGAHDAGFLFSLEECSGGGTTPLTPEEQLRADRALSAGHILFTALQSSPELHRVGALAERATFKKGGNRGSGEVFEVKLGSLLTAEVQAVITDDVIAALPRGTVRGLGRVKDVAFITPDAATRKGFDCIVQTTTTAGIVRYDWVNIKRCGGKEVKAEALAISTFLRVALGKDLRDKASRLNVPRTILAFAAGRAKIHTSDYFILVFGCKKGTLVSVRAQGLLSTVKNGKLAFQIHSNRSVIQSIPSDAQLPDDFDVNAAFWMALIRTMQVDELRLQFLAVAIAQGWSPARLKAAAAALDDVSDKAVVDAMIVGLLTLCPGLGAL